MNKHSPFSPADSRIRRAFFKSLQVLFILGLGIALVVWLSHNQAPTDHPIETAQPQPPQIPREQHAVPSLPFTDITAASGIAFTHTNGAYGQRLLPETMGSGSAFFDYDRDGDQDILLVNSRQWPQHNKGLAAHCVLYQNDGNGQFTDVSTSTGMDISLYGMGVAIGDYDGDGWADVYLTALHENHLLHNDHGHFHDVTEKAGVAGSRHSWSTSATFADIDNDGDLDLFVGNYVKWTPNIDLAIDFRLTGLGRAYGAPNHFPGTNSVLYRNNGDETFSDISKAAGINILDPVSHHPEGKALGVIPLDYDQDGWTDLFVANDTVRNFLFHNQGNGTFEETAIFEGLAYDRNGKATGAMGVDSSWFGNDADIAIAIGNFANEATSFYTTAEGQLPFADEAITTGIGPTSRLALTFGLFFLDADLDGWLDFFQANGHLEKEINKVQLSQTYAQPPQLFWQCGNACKNRYQPVTHSGDLNTPLVGRGASYADIDQDGDLDLLITQSGRSARLFRNDQTQHHHWLRILLKGKRMNRQGIGASVSLVSGGITQRRRVTRTHGYLSQSELPLTFGLGNHDHVETLTINWPDGTEQRINTPAIDQLLTIQHPAIQEQPQ